LAKLANAVNEFKNKGIYKGEWGPLDLRQSFAVNFLAIGGDMRELQRTLGHNNVFDTK
jgi:site-specific recombinase XerD